MASHSSRLLNGGFRFGELDYDEAMGSKAYVVLFVLILIATVVSVDVLFFRHRFLERLMANIGIVLVFAAFYFAFLKRH